MLRFSIEKGMNVLEIGSGRGEFLNEFRNEGLICDGIDIDSKAKTYIEDIKISTLDVSQDKFPFPDSHFDLVFQLFWKEHFIQFLT